MLAAQGLAGKIVAALAMASQDFRMNGTAIETCSAAAFGNDGLAPLLEPNRCAMLRRQGHGGLNKRDMIVPKFDKPRGVLHADSAAEPDIRHFRYWPSADLAPFVEHYWTVEWDLSEPLIRETLPHPSAHIVFEGRVAELSGVHTQRFTRRLEGAGRVFSVKFLPGGLRAFVATPVSRFSDRVRPLTEIFPNAPLDFALQVLGHADHVSAIGVIEIFLRNCKPRPDEHIGLVQRIAARVANDRRITRTEHLVAEFDIGARRLQRFFSQYVGVSPKWVIQRYRLHEAIERIVAGARIDWVGTALDLGYADQAHFIRDFKKLVGRSPADYWRCGSEQRG